MAISKHDMKKAGDSLEKFVSLISLVDIDEPSYKKDIKPVKKLCNKLRKGDMSVFKGEREDDDEE